MRCRPSIAVAVAVISTISTPATSVLELEEAQQATAVAALGEVAVVVQRGGQRPQLVVGDEALTVGSRLGRADQQALAALLARHPRLGVEQRVEGADVEPLRGERQLAHLEARSEEHTSELQSLMRISYAVFCLKKKKKSQ